MRAQPSQRVNNGSNKLSHAARNKTFFNIFRFGNDEDAPFGAFRCQESGNTIPRAFVRQTHTLTQFRCAAWPAPQAGAPTDKLVARAGSETNPSRGVQPPLRSVRPSKSSEASSGQLPRSRASWASTSALGLRQVHSTPTSLCAARGRSRQRRSAVSGTPP